jgi:serine/threonine protein phosphatase PrpC
MGCNSSKTYASQAPPALLGSKRLSVTVTHDNGPAVDSSLKLEGFVTKSTSILELLDRSRLNEKASCQSGPRNCHASVCLGSVTDDNLEVNKEKCIDVKGDTSVLDSSGVVCSCRKGLKPDSPNQDSYCVLMSEDFSLYGVFDGHGAQGHIISNFVKDLLPKIVLREDCFREDHGRTKALHNAFIKTQAEIQRSAFPGINSIADMSGTTATVVLHEHMGSKLYVANVGDSSCCLGKWNIVNKEKTDVKAVLLSKDHKPQDPTEKARIENGGGVVEFDGGVNHRVFAKNKPYPGLAMSRALGDIRAHKEAGITAEPSVLQHDLQGDENLILVCSDGVWEFISPQEAVEIVISFPSMTDGVQHLVSIARDRWIKEEDGQVIDDITAIAMTLIHDASL